MSIRLMSAIWALELPDSEKIVLLALADCADDVGFCWPSIATIARKVSKAERTVQGAIRNLCEKGHLIRTEVPGKGCSYVVNPRSDCTPAAPAPAQGTTQTPAAVAPKPSVTIIEEEEEARAIDCPQALFDAWNAMASRCQARSADKLTDKRRKSARARIEEYTEPVIREALRVIPRKPWLMGVNDRRWRATFDWLLRPDSIAKLREGVYDSVQPRKPANDHLGRGARALAILDADDPPEIAASF